MLWKRLSSCRCLSISAHLFKFNDVLAFTVDSRLPDGISNKLVTKNQLTSRSRNAERVNTCVEIPLSNLSSSISDSICVLAMEPSYLHRPFSGSQWKLVSKPKSINISDAKQFSTGKRIGPGGKAVGFSHPVAFAAACFVIKHRRQSSSWRMPSLYARSKANGKTNETEEDKEGLSEGSQEGSQYSAEEIEQNFLLMGLLFAMNHGVVTTPLAVSTTLLQLETATFGNGLLYVVTLLSSLLLGAPVVGQLGPKGGLTFGMFFYCLYIACFAGSLYFTGQEWLFTAGSACGGLAAGVLWTAQGTYFASSAAALSATGKSRDEATADLSGQFAFSYLFLEVLSKLGFSVLQTFGIEVSFIAGLYFLLAMLSLVLMQIWIYDLPSGATSTAKPLDKALAAISLWSDPAVWLLAPTNLSFGFCAAYMNGFVNARFAAAELGQESVAFLGAITALTAAFLAKAYGPLSSKVGKGSIISLGAGCAIAIPVLTYGGCVGWGWSLLSLYFLQGSVRAVYESTNRATFSDFFPGQSEGAFANCMLQSSLGFATCFFLQNSLSAEQLSGIIVALALSTSLGYTLASNLKQVDSGKWRFIVLRPLSGREKMHGEQEGFNSHAVFAVCACASLLELCKPNMNEDSMKSCVSKHLFAFRRSCC